ncbi:MAG TPA: TonB-dependent receptor, partial [Blastocatellia bacterium]|nr:TonB-dependent receptor [Blastocatellia bacterium]
MNARPTRHRSLFSSRALLLALFSALLLNGIVPAQGGTASVRGTVIDPDGKAVAGATVTLTNQDTKQSRTRTTSENGAFAFDLIPPGDYRAEAEAKGFKKVVLEELRAQVDKPTTATLQLQVGQITESVTVSAGAGDIQINTQDATIGNNFGPHQITQLPLESRNILDLLSLQPGVTPEGYVAGSRADQANITLDGVDINEQQGAAAFTPVIRLSSEAVQEFRVTTSNPNATQGRSSGAQVSMVTKSGTNEFHGSLFEYHRNTATTANDFFNNRSIDPETGKSIPRPKLIRNVFGGAIGGPIKRDKSFFFFSYEGRRDASEASVVRTVPLASLGRGEVRYPNTSGGITTLTTADINRIYPAVGSNPAAVAFLADAARRYPSNTDIVGDGFNTGGFRFNASTPVKLSSYVVRLDHALTSKQSLSGRFNYQQDVFGRAPQFPDTPSPNRWVHPIGVAAIHTWTISNTLVNNFHYGLTREAFTNQTDSNQNTTIFRFVFQPFAFNFSSPQLSRTTPVHNFTDDISWVKGSHNMQYGANVRLVRNNRTTFANSFDEMVANPSFYANSGAVLSNPLSGIAPGFVSGTQAAVTAVIGRFSQYTANFNFGADGNILPVGQGIGRKFNTEEYEFYGQDSWKINPNLTLTYGLRWSTSRPVYEADGLEVKPTTSLGDYFAKRVASSAAGTPFNELITVDLAGPANNRPGYYKWDKDNFQPRFALAWQPNFKNGVLKKIFGSNGASVFRGGFSMTNDNFGQQLAVQFDLNSTLGFSSNQTIAANTYNVTTRPAPRFTGLGQDVRSLPNIHVPGNLTFPLTTPADEDQRIESSLDDTLITPTNYSWNVTYGRDLPKGITIEASYIGRLGRHLLATRDIMALNNLVDSKSGMDWYTAAGQLHDLRRANTPLKQIKPIPYFENLFPNLGDNFWGDPSVSSTQAVYGIIAREDFFGFDFFNVLDWTFVQLLIDDLGIRPNMFFHPQYAALATFSTVANSDYHAGTLSIRQRLRNGTSFDFNYT